MVTEADLHAFHLSRVAPTPLPSTKPKSTHTQTTHDDPIPLTDSSNTNIEPPLRTTTNIPPPITEADVHAFHLSQICSNLPIPSKHPRIRPSKQTRNKQPLSQIPALPRTGPSQPRLSLSIFTSDTSLNFSPNISHQHGSGDLPPLSPSPSPSSSAPTTPRLELDMDGDDEEYDQLRSSSVVGSQRSDRTVRPLRSVKGKGRGEVIVEEDEEEEEERREPPSSPLAEKGGGTGNGKVNGNGLTGKVPRKSKSGGRAGELRGEGEDGQRKKGPSWATRTPRGA